MSLSVERLKEILAELDGDWRDMCMSPLVTAKKLRKIADEQTAIRELIAIKEDELKSHKKYNVSHVSVANNDLAEQSNQSCQYGRCPICGRPGIERERRLNGNDTCAGGHKYPSNVAILK